MKNIILSFLFICSFEAIGQTKDGQTVLLQEVVKDSIQLSQVTLKDKVIKWLGLNFNSTKTVINADTPESVVVKYLSPVSHSNGDIFYFNNTLMVDIKDNKVRIKVWVIGAKDREFSAADYFYPDKVQPKKIHAKWMATLMRDSNKLVNSLVDYVSKKDEW